MPLISIRQLFSVVLLLSSMGKIVGLYCKTTFENCIEQLAGCNFYREVVSVKNSSLSQIRYSLVVILELNGISEVQYKEIMIIDDE